MALNTQVNLYDRVDSSVQARFTAFGYEFTQAYQSAAAPWAESPELAVMRVGPELLTEFPMPVSAAEFKKVLGEIEYRRLAAKMLKVKSDQWQDGVNEEARLLELPNFVGWGEEPMNMANDARQLANRIVAALLEDGNNIASWENTDGVVTVKWFGTGHPNNPFDSNKGTYDNYYTTTPFDAAGIDFAFEAFRSFLGPNGKSPRGARLTHLVVHSTDERAALRLTGNDRILVPSLDDSGTQVASVERYNDIKELGLKVIVSDELTDDDYWYALSIQPGKGKPWAITKRVPGAPIPGMASNFAMSENTPWEWIVNDKNSSYYKDLKPGFVSLAARIDEGAALAHPWTALKFKKTA